MRGYSISMIEGLLQAVADHPLREKHLSEVMLDQLTTMHEKGVRAFIRDLADALRVLQEHALERCLVLEMVRRGSSGVSGAERILGSYAKQDRHYDVIVYGSAMMRRWGPDPGWAKSVAGSVKSISSTTPDTAFDISCFLIESCRPFVLRALLEDRACGRFLLAMVTAADQQGLSAQRRLLWNFAVSGAALGEKQPLYLQWPDAASGRTPFAILDAVLREKSAAGRVTLALGLQDLVSTMPLAVYETDLLVLVTYGLWLKEGRLSDALIGLLASRDDTLQVLRLYRWGFGGQGQEGLTFLRSLFGEVAEKRDLHVEVLGITAEMGLIDSLPKARDALTHIREADFDKNSRIVVEVLSGLVKNDQLDVAAQICYEEEELFFTLAHTARSAAEVYVAARDWERAGQAWSRLADLTRRHYWSVANAYRCYARAGNAERAREVRENIDFVDPEFVPTFPTIAYAACTIGDLTFAREMVERATPHFAQFEGSRREALIVAQTQSSGDLDLTPMPEEDCSLEGAPKALVIDPGFHYRSGHHFNYGKFAVDFLSSELGQDPDDVWLLIGGEVRDHNDRSLDGSIRPVFRFAPYAHKEMAVTEEAIDNLGRAFFQDLCTFSDQVDLSQVQAVYVHSMRANMILGFGRWIAKTFGGRPIIVIVGVIEVDYLLEPVEQRKLWARANKRGLSRLYALPNVQPLLYCETERAWTHFRRLLGPEAPFHRFPYLAASLAGQIKSSDDAALRRDKITFGTLGASTVNRGSDLFPQLVGLFSEVEEVNWVLQLTRYFVEGLGPDHVNHLEYAVEQGACVWLDDRLSVEAYFAAMRSIDVMVLPYRERYAVSGSGVFYEAMQLERFLVVPKQTFMEGVVREMHYPARLIGNVDLKSLAASLHAIVEERDKHQRRLRRFGQEGRGRLPIKQFRDLFRKALTQVEPKLHNRALQG